MSVVDISKAVLMTVAALVIVVPILLIVLAVVSLTAVIYAPICVYRDMSTILVLHNALKGQRPDE